MRIAAALAICPILLSLSAAAQISAYRVPEYNLNSRHYQNMDYGFSVEIPDYLPACVSDGANHGVKILLDLRSRCGGGDREPHVDVYADYNMPGDADSPERRARIDCPDPAARKVVLLEDRALSGRKAAGCRTYLDWGKILVDIFTFRKTDSRDPGGWIVVGAALTTTASRYNSDMREFRKIMQAVRIAPDGPLK